MHVSQRSLSCLGIDGSSVDLQDDWAVISSCLRLQHCIPIAHWVVFLF